MSFSLRRRYAEKAGTTTNIEGRVTSLSQQVTVAGTARADWMVAADLAQRLGTDFAFETVDDVTASLAATVDGFEVLNEQPLADNPNGVLVVAALGDAMNAPTITIGDPNAYNFSLIVSRKLYDTATGTAQAPSLAPLAKAGAVHVHPLDVARIGSAPGREVKVTSNKATIVLAAGCR